MATLAPKVARIRVREETPGRLVIDYHPVAYFLAGAGMGTLCLVAGARAAGAGDARTALIFLGAGLLFAAAFCLVFYRRTTLTLDRAANTITHARRVAFRRSAREYPLDGLERATLDIETQGDGRIVFARPVMTFRDADAVPVIRARITGDSPALASRAINRWLGVPD